MSPDSGLVALSIPTAVPLALSSAIEVALRAISVGASLIANTKEFIDFGGIEIVPEIGNEIDWDVMSLKASVL